jgi:hypothetical protein
VNNAMTRAIKSLAIILNMVAVVRTFGEEVTLTPNHTLRIDFQINGPFEQAPDALSLGWEHSPVEVDRIGSRHAALYRGPDLVGENVESSFGDATGLLSLNPSNAWRTADSLWNFGLPSTVDFGNLFTEPQSGHIDFFIDAGRMSFNTDNIHLAQILGTAWDSGFLIEPAPIITNVAIVSEPSAVLLVGMAAIAVYALRK